MRIWSFHPRYLDTKGLGGVWCETLLAKAVLEGKTKGYKHHPQLNRFRDTSDPVKYISTYLHLVHSEATKRGFKYDGSKVGKVADLLPIAVTKGQLEYEWKLLLAKLKKRSPEWLAQLSNIAFPDAHPIFKVVEGDIASWEVIQAPEVKDKKTNKKARKESDYAHKKIRNSNKEVAKVDHKVDKEENKPVSGKEKIRRNLVKAGAAVQQESTGKSTKRKYNATPTAKEVRLTKRQKLSNTKTVCSSSNSSENIEIEVVAVRTSRARNARSAVK